MFGYPDQKFSAGESQLETLGFTVVTPPPSPTTRFFRHNEGTTDVYETNARLIPSPKTHFDVQFKLLGAVDNVGTFVAQNIISTSTGREFQIFQNGSTLRVRLGGSESSFSVAIVTAGVYRITNDGSNLELFKDGTSLEIIPSAIGAGEEPTATFTMCGRHHGSPTSYSFLYEGFMSDVIVRDNTGTITNKYLIDDNSDIVVDSAGNADAVIINGNADDWKQYTEQDTGEWLGEDLITQQVWESPLLAEATWNFSSNQWILTGDGSLSQLVFVSTALQPIPMRIEGFCPAITGHLAVVGSNAGQIGITTAGQYVFDIDNNLTASQVFKRHTGVVNATLDKFSMREVLYIV